MDFQAIWDAAVEGAVDRACFDIGLRIAARYVLPPARHLSTKVWRWYRPRLTADYAAAKTAHPWRKVVAGLALPAFIGGLVAGLLTGGIDGNAPPWARLRPVKWCDWRHPC